MKRNFKTALFCAALSAVFFASTASAQVSPIPERRSIVSENTDFYGGDLRSILDTTVELCENSCLGDLNCQAYTFNANKDACFLKQSVGSSQSFEGALSAQIIITPRTAIQFGAIQAGRLSFLPAELINDAAAQAENMGLDYPVNDQGLSLLNLQVRGAIASDNFNAAYWARAAALNLDDSAEGWLQLADLATKYQTEDKSTLRWIASASAINAFLRSDNPQTQSDALTLLAEVLEVRNYDRETIPTLRLAQAIMPTPETAQALDRVIALYGFHIAEHQVDNDSAAPRICVSFSESLEQEGVDYSTYVRIPQGNFPVEVNGSQLCIDGLRHGTRYQITLREGLPAQSGEKLIASVDIDVYIRDRSPAIRFPGRSYVLPRTANASIPIIGINATEVNIRIHRIGDRNLVRSIQEDLFGRNLYDYTENWIATQFGETVWEGTGKISSTLNEDTVTALPLGDALSGFEPGAYAITAKLPTDSEWDDPATQWFIVTDLGIETLMGNDGLHVFLRNLSDAEVTAGVTVALIDHKNEVLGEIQTDADGYARFDPGLTMGTKSSAPAMLMATTDNGDFAFIDLGKAALDLSDRGIEGRISPPPVDMFMTTERGAYRPGETVFATILTRDTAAQAISGLPVTIVVTRPDGVEHTRQILADMGAGGRAYSMQLATGAQRGTWRMRAYADPNGPALASIAFLVEDFLPEKIDFELTLPDAPISLANPPTLKLEANYLYGAPAADMSIEAHSVLSSTTSIPDYPGYRFGRHDEVFYPLSEYLDIQVFTAPDGTAEMLLPIPLSEEITQPMSLTTTVRLLDNSGRPVEREITRTVEISGQRIGIKPLFDGVAEEGSSAGFEVIALDNSGRTSIDNITWELTRIERHYQWYRMSGYWNYEPIITRTRIAAGDLSIGSDMPAKIEALVDWGRYELRLIAKDSPNISSSVSFRAGWYAADAGSDTPDMLEVGLDKEDYSIGDTAQLRLVARYPGKALIRVISDRLISMQAIDVAEGETLVSLEITDDWGPGAYVMATLIRPMDEAARRNPTRAIGLSYAPVDPESKMLSATFTTPDEVDPRGVLTANLQVNGIAAGETVYATIAAVDVGILNLTGFKAPSAGDHYFGQRQLGMEIRDVYGQLIDGMHGVMGELRSGGDAQLAQRNNPPPTEELVAYFSGPIQADANGVITADFDIPDFNGTVKLMAIVWSDSSVGQASKDILVRDPVVVTANHPRFMAPDDTSWLSLDFAHVFGQSGTMHVEITATGSVTLVNGPVNEDITLADKGRLIAALPLRATGVGNGTIEVALTTPNGKRLVTTEIIPVRANDPEVVHSYNVTLAAGGVLTLDDTVFTDFVPGSGSATLAVGPIARFDVPGLLDALNRYPYGCTEQLTSRAMPLMYFGRMTAAMGIDDYSEINDRVNQAIAGVLANQAANGAFGLWRPDHGDLWLDAYATDFLSRANALGYIVPDLAFRSALDNLQNQLNYANDFEDSGQDIAYALMVLAREKMASIGDLRYYAEEKSDDFATPLAMAQVGMALAYYGDQERADKMFALAYNDIAVSQSEDNFWRSDYGSDLRDAAGVISLAQEAGSNAVDISKLVNMVTRNQTQYRSTQEQTWMLLAAHSLIENADHGDITINGQPASGPVMQRILSGDGSSTAIRNNGDNSVDTMLTVTGVPSIPEPQSGNGYRISRDYYSLDGELVEPQNITQNMRLAVVLTITPERTSDARLMISDPLPAGLEIDNPNLLRSGDIDALDWLEVDNVAHHTEFRDDRFVAAVDWSGSAPFTLAYIVRAVSSGQFHSPAASVEDMYRPTYRARTQTGSMTIAPAN